MRRGRTLFALLAFLEACAPAWAQLPPPSTSITIGQTPVNGGTNTDCLNVTSGKVGQQGCGGAATSVTVGTTTISGGSTGQVLYDKAGVLGEYTPTQLTALINVATAALSGALPAWPNNTTTFFRGDGSYPTLNCAALSNGATGCSTIVGTMATQAANAVAITGGTIAGLTGLAVRDTSAAFDVTIAAVSSVALTAGRTLTVDVVNGARMLKLGSNLTIASDPGAVTGALKSNGSGTFSQAACGDLSNAGTACSATIGNYLPLAGGTMTGLINATGTEGNQYGLALGGQAWKLSLVSGGNLYVNDATNSKTPFVIAPNTSNSITIGTSTLAHVGAATFSSTVGLLDTSAAHYVQVTATSSTALTADRALTFDLVNAARTLKLGANLTIATDPGAVTGALKSNGSGTFTAAPTPTTQAFTTGTSATYTTPAGVTWIEVYIIGAGGGGGGGGTGSPGGGGTGGTSTFNSISAAGANGGQAAPAITATSPGGGGVGGAGGTGSATRRASGQGGAPGLNYVPSVLNGGGGTGGEAGCGFGGGAPGPSSGGGNAGGAFGGGGSGSAGAVATTGGSGAGGGGGGECAYLIIGSPAATYTYSVGGAGTAGSAGTGGNAGGAGSAGYIIVIEHYGS